MDKTIEVLTTEQKLSIYLDYFKGRDDCYAYKWENDKGSGYSPKYTSKARFLSKDERKNLTIEQLYLPLTKEVFFSHLKGNDEIGIYPITDDNNCYFLMIEFDSELWKSDVSKFSSFCDSLNLSHLISINANSACIWFFFSDAKLAKDVRKVARFLLTKAMMEQNLSTFNLYDKIHPQYDQLQPNTIGNFVLLPLNGKSGLMKKTLFVDHNLVAYDNQFLVLKETKKITDDEFNVLLSQVSKDNELGVFGSNAKQIEVDIFDFTMGFTISVDSQITFTKADLSVRAIAYLKRLSSLTNPEFYKRQNMKFSTFGVSRIIELYEETEDKIILPIGLLEDLIIDFNKRGIIYTLDDLRTTYPMTIDLSFNGKLNSEQEEVFKAVLKVSNGVIVAPTGFGKTVLGVALLSELKLKTLIIVNRVSLANQWEEQINNFTGFNEVGKLYDKFDSLGSNIDIATIQSLQQYDAFDSIAKAYSLILIDEAHHGATKSFEKTIKRFSAKRIYGLTATLKRSDGLEAVTTTLLGPVITEVTVDSKGLKRELDVKVTSFKLDNPSATINEAYASLFIDDQRNKLIIEDIKNSIKEERHILVLTDRKKHLDILEGQISKFTKNLLVVHGKLKPKEKIAFRELLTNKTGSFVILSTGKYIGEGFDDDRLDTLFLTMPFKWKGTLQQYVGRLNRTRENKNEIKVYDYADLLVGYFSSMYLERLKGYRKLGYELIVTNDFETTIYNSKNYLDALTDEIKNSSDVAFLVKYSNDEVLSSLTSICNNPFLELKNSGINAIIIDKKVVWYGSVNPFIKRNSTDSELIRYCDSILANSLIEAYYKDKENDN